MFVKTHSLQKLKIRLYTKLVSNLIDVYLLLIRSYLPLPAQFFILLVEQNKSSLNLLDNKIRIT